MAASCTVFRMPDYESLGYAVPCGTMTMQSIESEAIGDTTQYYINT
jgi:hypothetical protein